jgi:DNA ligase (NAD+)
MFANPRNLAAGTIRQLDAREVTRRGLQLVFYGVGACLPESARPGSQRTFHALLERWRLPRMERHWTARGADELWSVVQVLGRERAKWEFPTDGVVVKADAVELQRKVGTAENAPRWAIAYKFAPERIETEVLAITVQIGRTGALTPVAELAPVELAGSKVTRATLHNRAEIARRDVRVGDWVIIEKAGEIVPAIVGVNVARRPSGTSAFEFPETCPVCRTPVAEVPGGTTVRCPNFTCLAQVRRRLEHFASKECLDIKGLGPAMIGSLVNHGWVRDVPDLYRLRREDLLTIGKDVEKTVDRLLAEIEASKRAELWRVVHGLGVPQVGAAAAKDVARRFGSLEALVAATPNDLGRDAAGKAMGRFLADENGRKLIGGLIDAGVGAAPPARE